MGLKLAIETKRCPRYTPQTLPILEYLPTKLETTVSCLWDASGMKAADNGVAGVGLGARRACQWRDEV